jgi:hypothetical protein
MIINQIRTYHETRTVSVLYEDGVTLHGAVIEDVGRPAGVKVPGKTCIPEGVYNVSITPSPKFKKPMILLSNKADGSIQRHDISFTGIRVHAGISVDHTEGCPLFQDYEKLQARIQEALDRKEKVLWIINKGV